MNGYDVIDLKGNQGLSYTDGEYDEMYFEKKFFTPY